jgi:hypothetical protein
MLWLSHVQSSPVLRSGAAAIWTAILMFALLASPSVVAGEKAKASDANLSNEMAELFDLYCLQNYPDIEAMDRLAMRRGDTALSSEDLPMPGKKWAVKTATGQSVISGVAGPPGGCSVRRMTPQGLPDPGPFIRALTAWTQAHHLKLEGWVEPMRLPGMTNFGRVIVDEAGNRVEAIIISIITFRPGQPQSLPGPSDDGSRVEVYLGRGRPTLPVPK